MIEFYSSHVSLICFGPHQSIFRSFFYKLYVQIWYVAIRALNLHIQLVKNSPEDGTVRSETCRANICDE